MSNYSIDIDKIAQSNFRVGAITGARLMGGVRKALKHLLSEKITLTEQNIEKMLRSCIEEVEAEVHGVDRKV